MHCTSPLASGASDERHKQDPVVSLAALLRRSCCEVTPEPGWGEVQVMAGDKAWISGPQQILVVLVDGGGQQRGRERVARELFGVCKSSFDAGQF